MRNELLWFLMLLLNFLCIIFAYWKFGKIGLFIWIPISTILANIQVNLLVNLFGFTTTLGNILYAGGFLVTDILSENYGKEDAKKAVKIGFFSLIATTILMKVAVSFSPAQIEEDFIAFNGIKRVFDLMPRLSLASLTAYWFSQSHDIWAYQKWKKLFPERKYIWIRNNMSTLVSQIIDNLIFTLIAFWGVYPFDVLVQIFISTYLLKFIIALADTPFVYIANSLKLKKIVDDY
jgi:uncharacterized integral membrane protein (TIGR00697 family)